MSNCGVLGEKTGQKKISKNKWQKTSQIGVNHEFSFRYAELEVLAEK